MQKTETNGLRIGYAGSLSGYRPGSDHQPWWRPIADWFWTYRNRRLQHHTRSGYFLLKGMEAFASRYPEQKHLVQLHWWGMIDPENVRQARELGLEAQVLTEGYFDKATSKEKLLACDVLFLPLETADDPLFIPGKIFDYLHLAKPVLVLGPESDCTRILERAGVGYRVNPEDPAAVAAALADLLEHRDQLSERFPLDRKYVEENFHFRNLTDRMHEVFQEVQSR